MGIGLVLTDANRANELLGPFKTIIVAIREQWSNLGRHGVSTNVAGALAG
ncbi:MULTISPECIES: hypothetical protein [unclassified Lysobacter]|nr:MULTISPECIES: hypothetical protein [unclassified Lysobacter]MBT2745863.1 hypothetical protein [Lysobacter sp. ISL-42]MBT2749578.1 hypothetical protein [Lysobacter sp. ISL-50]MBT2778778.1 hypothetical protein [Lysobacter sp. ISL-54]MBT2781373.1 hypothetical protein [Lysobacter sp. ISL-52]